MAFADKKTEIKYKNDFARQNYDRIVVQMPKGGKAIIQAAADRAGQSVNAWINDAIDDKLERE